MSEGNLCRATTFNSTIGSLSHLSFYHEIGYVNNSNKIIYMGTSYGDRPIALEPSSTMTMHTDTLTIYIRMSSGAARKTDGYKEIIGKEGLVVNVIDIPLRNIQVDGYYYCKELDLCFCFDPNKLVVHHKKLDKNIDKRIDAEVKVALDACNSAPVKIFGNDATGTFNTVWVTINKLLTSCTISNLRDTGSYIRVSIGTPSGKYNDYDVDIDKIRKGDIVEVVTEDGIISLGPTETAMRHYLFRQENSDAIKYTSNQIDDLIKERCKSRDQKIELLKAQLEQLKFEYKQLEEEIKLERLRTDKLKDFISENEKMEDNRNKRSQERSKMEYEDRKYEREERARVSDNTTDILISILKVVGASIPIALAIYAAIKKNS